MTIIIFDTETSGLPIKNDFSNIRMLELGYLILDDELNVLQEKNYLNDVEIEVPEIITKLTGITKEKLENEGIDITKILFNLLEDTKEADIMIAHNNRFDLGVLRQEFKNIGAESIFEERIYKRKINLDSLKIFKKEINKKEIQNLKLQTIYKYYHEDDFIQTHRALDDCVMLHSCLKKINGFNPYKFYINSEYNFKKYPKQSLKNIYRKDTKYVLDFIKKNQITKKILKFLI